MSIDEQEQPESRPNGEPVNEQPEAAADQPRQDEPVDSPEPSAAEDASGTEPVAEGVVIEAVVLEQDETGQVALAETEAAETATGEVVAEGTASDEAVVDDAVIDAEVLDVAPGADVPVALADEAGAETAAASEEVVEVDAEDVPSDNAATVDEDASEAVTAPAAEGEDGVEMSADDEPETADEAAATGDEPAEPAEPVEPSPRLPAEQLEAIVEALIFASPEPLSLKTLSKLLAEEPGEDVAAAVQAVTARYEAPGGLHLVEVAGGFQITTRPDCHEWVRRLFHERTTQKLSVQALETLAVTAYRQPITAAEIGEIRGVNTSGVLSTLLERHLLKIVGRKNVVGRPFLYGTTREFLIRFGLKDLSDLPRVEDMAQALGFDAPAILRERSITDEMLPLDEEQGA